MNIYIDTCVLPRLQLQAGQVYRDRYGSALGFELLPMFDLQEFEDNLKQNLDLLAGGPLMFHEPVWGVDHAAPKGSPAWEEGMFHLQMTKKYADILHNLDETRTRTGKLPKYLEERYRHAEVLLRNTLDAMEEHEDG